MNDDTFDTRLDAEFRRRGIDPAAPTTDEVIVRLGFPLAALISSRRKADIERGRVLAALLAAAAAELDDAGARFTSDRVARAAAERDAKSEEMIDVTAIDDPHLPMRR